MCSQRLDCMQSITPPSCIEELQYNNVWRDMLSVGDEQLALYIAYIAQ